jgi:hypothetical protein
MQLAQLFALACGRQVISGPFRGVRYIANSSGSVLPPKLLGTYEQELHSCIAEIIRAQPELIVNIGAGEGYYAIGLARRLPRTEVVAFEGNPVGQQLLAAMAKLNRVGDRVQIRGFCTPADLENELAPLRSPVVVIDAEGAELTLLDPGPVPSLRRAVILAEIHDFILPNATEVIRRFDATHDQKEIWSRPRSARDLPKRLRPFLWTPWKKRVLAALEEQRPGPMRWVLFTPRKEAAAGETP